MRREELRQVAFPLWGDEPEQREDEAGDEPDPVLMRMLKMTRDQARRLRAEAWELPEWAR